jgi:branched-chain amino acid aminotransferase
MGFNIFAVINAWPERVEGIDAGARFVVTSPSGVLLVITRQSVLDILFGTSHPRASERIGANHLTAANAVFITSTAGGIMPVRRIDGHPVGNGVLGPYRPHS